MPLANLERGDFTPTGLNRSESACYRKYDRADLTLPPCRYAIAAQGLLGASQVQAASLRSLPVTE